MELLYHVSESANNHKSTIKLYFNYVTVIQNLTLCQNYKRCFKTEQMPFLERCDGLVYKIEFKSLYKRYNASSLGGWGSPTEAQTQIIAQRFQHPACAGRTERLHHAGRAGQKTDRGNRRIHDKDSRKHPKLKRNHKRQPTTMKTYPIIPSVQVTTEKVYVDTAV